MADKNSPKRPRKKRSSFEDAFAMALRATFAQDEAVEPETVSLDSEVQSTPVSEGTHGTISTIENDSRLYEQTEKLAHTESQSSVHSVESEEPIEKRHDILSHQVQQMNISGTQSEQTKYLDETGIQNKYTKQSEEISAQIDTTKSFDKIDIQNEQKKRTDYIYTPTEQAKSIDELNTLSGHTKHTDEILIENEHVKSPNIINKQNIQTKGTNKSNIRNEQIRHTDEENVQNRQENKIDEIDSFNEQTKCPHETNTVSNQSKTTDEAILQNELNKIALQNEHTQCADETTLINEQNKSACKASTRKKHTKQTNEKNTQSKQTNKNQLVINTELTSHQNNALLKVRLHKPIIESKAEKALVAYLQANGDHVSSYSLISQETGITLGTLRRCFKKFNEYGIISTSKYCGRGKMQGLVITIQNLQVAIDNIQIMHLSSAKQLASYNRREQTKASENKITGTPFVPYEPKIESPQKKVPLQSKDYKAQVPSQQVAQSTPPQTPIQDTAQTAKGISQFVPIIQWLHQLTNADIATFWPSLSAISFGAEQIHQALQTLEAQGKEFDQQFGENFKQGLDHADFDLGNENGIKDHHGRIVANQCEYIYSSFAKDGYYAAPENYVSPQARRAHDEAARLAKERAALENLEKELRIK